MTGAHRDASLTFDEAWARLTCWMFGHLPRPTGVDTYVVCDRCQRIAPSAVELP